MTIKEIRIRYELETASGAKTVNAVITDEYGIDRYKAEIERVGYRLVGIDERVRDEHTWMPLNEGWKEI